MLLWRVVILIAGGNLLSGCDLLLVAVADAMTPDPVQAVDVTWARDPALCGKMIHAGHREAFLMSGDLDLPGYTPTPVPLIWGRPTPHGRVNDRPGLHMAGSARVMNAGVPYVYSEEREIDLGETASLPPILDVESGDYSDAIKQAWHIALYRENADYSLVRECVFVVRRMWFNLAI